MKRATLFAACLTIILANAALAIVPSSRLIEGSANVDMTPRTIADLQKNCIYVGGYDVGEDARRFSCRVSEFAPLTSIKSEKSYSKSYYYALYTLGVDQDDPNFPYYKYGEHQVFVLFEQWNVDFADRDLLYPIYGRKLSMYVGGSGRMDTPLYSVADGKQQICIPTRYERVRADKALIFDGVWREAAGDVRCY